MAIYELREKAIVLRPGDDVAVMKEAVPPGTVLQHEGRKIVATREIPPGHKIALNPVRRGDPVRKYGQVIGFATEEIVAGDHVHVHNCHVGPLNQQYEVGTDVRPVPYYPKERMRYFHGYLREDGRVGTRNYIAIVPSVNCSTTVCRFIADRFREVTRDYPNVDGVIALNHKSGCGTKEGGEEYHTLQRTLAGFARHPNVGAFFMVGLGCEVNQAEVMARNAGIYREGQPAEARPPLITIQDTGGTQRTIDAGVRIIESMLPRADSFQRTKRPISEIVLATNCGGSDAYSGITANPALGWAVDELVRYGGTGVLAETSEIYGAEQLLVKRAVNEGVAKKLIDRFKWWEWYTGVLGAEMDNNPAPGNKAGGLTTVYEKSLGGVTKGGTTPLMDVFLYAQPITTRGFVFMDTPGFDPVSVSGLVAGGCNVVVFTTGRGSCFGFKPAPSIKVATSSHLFQQMTDDMDIDAGVILNGVPLEEVGRQIFEEIVAVASGKKTKSELAGYGEEEFAPWVIGPVL